MKFLILITFFSLLFIQTEAQSIYLEKNSSGLMSSAGYSHADDLYSLQGSFGYSPDGRFNITGSISNTHLEQEMTSLSLRGGLSYCIFKPQKDIPFTLLLGTGYQFTTYESEFLTDDNASITNQDIDLSGKLIANLNFMNFINIYPAFGVTQVWRNLKIESDEFNRDDNKDFSYYSVSVGFGISFIEKHMLIITPRMSFSDEHETYSVSISYMIIDLI